MYFIDCSHSTYHHEVKEVPEHVLNAGNEILSERIHMKVTQDKLIYASQGPWLERVQSNNKLYPFQAHGKGYRLVYDTGKHLHCIHLGETNDQHTPELHSAKKPETSCQIL